MLVSREISLICVCEFACLLNTTRNQLVISKNILRLERKNFSEVFVSFSSQVPLNKSSSGFTVRHDSPTRGSSSADLFEIFLILFCVSSAGNIECGSWALENCLPSTDCFPHYRLFRFRHFLMDPTFNLWNKHTAEKLPSNLSPTREVWVREILFFGHTGF